MSYSKQKDNDGADVRIKTLLLKHAAELPCLDAYPLFVKTFHAGDPLAVCGEPLTHLCFLVEGYATVFNAMENGRTALLTEYRGVQTIGEVELLMNYPVLTGSIRAHSDGVMLCIPLTKARGQIDEDAAMLRFLGRQVAQKLEHASRLNAQDRVYPLAARLAAYLLYCQCVSAQKKYTPLHLTRLSELMGASYRHLLRTLKSFADQGYIQRLGGGYRITNRQALQQLAGNLRYD